MVCFVSRLCHCDTASWYLLLSYEKILYFTLQGRRGTPPPQKKWLCGLQCIETWAVFTLNSDWPHPSKSELITPLWMNHISSTCIQVCLSGSLRMKTITLCQGRDADLPSTFRKWTGAWDVLRLILIDILLRHERPVVYLVWFVMRPSYTVRHKKHTKIFLS